MSMTKCALMGGVAGLVGAAVWAALAYFSGHEIGWIAWGIGGLVGLTVLKTADGENSFKTGALAALISVLAILGGKFAATHFLVEDVFKGVTQVGPTSIQDEVMIADIAREVVAENTQKNKKMAWPVGVKPEEATVEKEFPKEVWAEANKRWLAKPAAEREAMKEKQLEELAQILGGIKGQMRDGVFQNSFSPMDLIFFGLAIVTAYKFGAGVQGG